MRPPRRPERPLPGERMRRTAPLFFAQAGASRAHGQTKCSEPATALAVRDASCDAQDQQQIALRVVLADPYTPAQHLSQRIVRTPALRASVTGTVPAAV